MCAFLLLFSFGCQRTTYGNRFSLHHLDSRGWTEVIRPGARPVPLPTGASCWHCFTFWDGPCAAQAGLKPAMYMRRTFNLRSYCRLFKCAPPCPPHPLSFGNMIFIPVNKKLFLLSTREVSRSLKHIPMSVFMHVWESVPQTHRCRHGLHNGTTVLGTRELLSIVIRNVSLIMRRLAWWVLLEVAWASSWPCLGIPTAQLVDKGV